MRKSSVPSDKMPNEPMPKTRRKKDLAKIHIAKKELSLDDREYRQIIEGVMALHDLAGRPSSANLPPEARETLLGTFREMGWTPLRKDDDPVWKGRYTESSEPGKATQKQLDYIAMMEWELGWIDEPKRLRGFIERTRGEKKRPWVLSNRQASDVITGLEKMTGRKPGDVDA